MAEWITPSMFRQITSGAALEKEFSTEIHGEWAHLYGDRQYVLQKVRAAFFWFDKGNIQFPETREAWARQILKFCDNGLGRKKEQERLDERESMVNRIPFEPLPPIPDIKECSFCHGLGYVWVYSLDHSHDTLMHCDCVDPKDTSYEQDIPQWNYKLAQIYRKDPCSLEWFKPDTNDGFLSKQVQEKIFHWTNRKRLAKEFWINKREEKR